MWILDHILVFRKNNEKHLKHWRTIFDGLHAADFKLKRNNCDFFECKIHYLGHS